MMKETAQGNNKPEIPLHKITIVAGEIDKIYDFAVNRGYIDMKLDDTHTSSYLFATNVDDAMCNAILMEIRGTDGTAINQPNEFNFVIELQRSQNHCNPKDPSRSYISEKYIQKMLTQPALSAAHAVYEIDSKNDQKIRFIKNNIYFGIYLGFRSANDHLNYLNASSIKFNKSPDGFGFLSTSSMYITMENPDISKEAPLYEHYVPLTTEAEFRNTIATFAEVSKDVIEAFYRAYQEPLPNVTLVTKCPEIRAKVKPKITPKVRIDVQPKNVRESVEVKSVEVEPVKNILACDYCRSKYVESKLLELTRGRVVCPTCGGDVHLFKEQQ